MSPNVVLTTTDGDSKMKHPVTVTKQQPIVVKECVQQPQPEDGDQAPFTWTTVGKTVDGYLFAFFLLFYIVTTLVTIITVTTRNDFNLQ
jgi:hypothetical protein